VRTSRASWLYFDRAPFTDYREIAKHNHDADIDDRARAHQPCTPPHDDSNSLSGGCISALNARALAARLLGAPTLNSTKAVINCAGRKALRSNATNDDFSAAIDDSFASTIRSARAIAFAASHTYFATPQSSL
jgi:hypothetical protein